jgi:hypothetical protein
LPGTVGRRVCVVQVVVVVVDVVGMPAPPTVRVVIVSVPEVVVLLTVAVNVEAVRVTVLFDVVVDTVVEFAPVTVVSGSVVTVVVVTVVVPPLIVLVTVIVLWTVVVLVTLHRRVKWLRVPLTRWRRHLAGTVLGPLPAERATPTGTSSTTARTARPNERMTEARFMGTFGSCRPLWSTSQCRSIGCWWCWIPSLWPPCSYSS